MVEKDVDDILEKYRRKLNGRSDTEGFSRQYNKFRGERVKKTSSFYEKSCKFCEKLIKVKVDKKRKGDLVESINRIELSITPEGSTSLAFFVGFGSIFVGILVLVLSWIFGENPSVLLPFIFVILGIIFIKILLNRPIRLANRLRLKAGNQMVLCILYVVMYMRHTSNLEHGIKFAAQNVNNPLSDDLKKIIWDVETGKYSTVREALDIYLESWRKYNQDFVNSFHLIESSLFEPSEERRIEILEKGLDTMLEGTHERMLHYAQDLKNPITNLYMLGIILPVLGLIILPLVGAFVGLKWYWLALVYNFVLPVFVYSMGLNILEKRPSGEGEATDVNDFVKYSAVRFLGVNLNPLILVIPIFLLIFLIGISPLILKYFGLGDFFGYVLSDSTLLGPFGIVALIFSLAIPLSFALSVGIYYRLKTKNLIIIRKHAKELEKEFSGSLFQLGNRIEDGLPSEIAFSKVAQNVRGTATGDFFNIVSYNVRNLGMGLKDAIFNLKIGALAKYPSKVIRSTMQVLLESSKRGPKVAAHSLISISNYMTNIHKVNERLRDLLADVLSSLRGQINFLTPIIAGIVVGIGNTITSVVVGLGPAFGGQGDDEAIFGLNSSVLQDIFPLSNVMPAYFFQIIVGIYLVEITIIMTILANYIENGVDNLNKEHTIGKNLLKSVTFYTIVTFIVTLILYFMTKGVLGVTTGSF